MYSISEIAKLTELTTRTLRHYEDKGLLVPLSIGNNGYRYYNDEAIARIDEIKKLKLMEFSLEEIKELIKLKEESLENSLMERLTSKLSFLDSEISRLKQSKNEIKTQILTIKKFFDGEELDKSQRRVLMETIKNEILKKLKTRKSVSQKDLEYLERENYLFDTSEKLKFIEAVKKCLEFARKEGIKLGPARGASPALLSLYALGWSDFDPGHSHLIPERFSITDFDLHIDVEFKNGQKFINYCTAISAELSFGKIEAFKLPILDIIENVHGRLGKVIDYDKIDNNDPMILDLFRRGDIDKIFSFDFPKNTLMAKHMDEHYYRNGLATNMLSEYLKSQPINDFDDLLNIEAVFRPDNLRTKPFMQEYIDRYPKAKKQRHFYNCLSDELNEKLNSNYGVIIYQEDIIEIIHFYTQWDYEKCNQVRRSLSKEEMTPADLADLEGFTGKEVLDLIVKESPVVFCKAHSRGAWPTLIKKTAVLKSLHKDLYYEEIEKWEKNHGLSWADFGFISGGVSILQQ